MMQTIIEAIRSEGFLSGVASTITIISLIWGVFHFFRSKRKCLYLHNVRRTFLSRQLPNGLNVRFYNDSSEANSLVQDYYLIVNKTPRTLTDKAFAHSIQLQRQKASCVFSVRLLDMPGSGHAEIKDSENMIELVDIQLKSGNGLLLEVIHDGTVANELGILQIEGGDARSYTLERFVSSGKFVVGSLLLLIVWVFVGEQLLESFGIDFISEHSYRFETAILILFGVGVITAIMKDNWRPFRRLDRWLGQEEIEDSFLLHLSNEAR